MVFDKVFQQFVEKSPVSVMFRGTLENVFSARRLDAIFASTAVRQHVGPLLFSTCAELLSQVVLSSRKSVNAAYQARQDEMKTSKKAVYAKLAGIEPFVSERLVRDTARSLATVVDELDAAVEGPLPGFDVRIVDGNHLSGTDHRLAELRRLGAAALPGQTLAILDPQRRLIEDVVTCEDGHANERTMIPYLLELVRSGQCWLADSLFCTCAFIFGVAARKAFFVIRQHGGTKGRLIGKRKKIGRCSTGVVYEQDMVLQDRDGSELTLRRITIMRDKPTANGEMEVHLLTNLPAKVTAVKAAEAYLDRWQIENAFQDVTTTLRCEINTLGYPKAALFGFCLALTLFNAMSVVKAAMRAGAKNNPDPKRKLSSYYIADEVAGTWRGMEIAIAKPHWEEAFAKLTPKQLAAKLQWLARNVDLKRFYTNSWTPKRPQPKRISGQRGNHVSTHNILLKRAEQAASKRTKTTK